MLPQWIPWGASRLRCKAAPLTIYVSREMCTPRRRSCVFGKMLQHHRQFLSSASKAQADSDFVMYAANEIGEICHTNAHLAQDAMADPLVERNTVRRYATLRFSGLRCERNSMSSKQSVDGLFVATSCCRQDLAFFSRTSACIIVDLAIQTQAAQRPCCPLRTPDHLANTPKHRVRGATSYAARKPCSRELRIQITVLALHRHPNDLRDSFAPL